MTSKILEVPSSRLREIRCSQQFLIQSMMCEIHELVNHHNGPVADAHLAMKPIEMDGFPSWLPHEVVIFTAVHVLREAELP